MSSEWQARSSSLAWSNPLAWWWSLLTLVSGANIAVWFLLYHAASRTAGRQLRRRVRHRAHAPPLCGLCFRLRIQVVPAARGCSADLLVRHLAVERHRRTVGGNRRRDLLRGAVGHYPAPTGHDDGSGHHLERRVGDRAADPHRGMLLMVRRADHQLFGQRHRKFDMGRRLLRGRDWPLPVAAGVSTVRFAWPSPSRSSGLQAIYVSHDRRRPDVPEPMAGRGCRWRQVSAAA